MNLQELNDRLLWISVLPDKQQQASELIKVMNAINEKFRNKKNKKLQ